MFFQTNKKTTAGNGRFCEMAAVSPQTILCGFESASPARTFVNPRLREAATTLWAILRTAHRVTEKPKAESGGKI